MISKSYRYPYAIVMIRCISLDQMGNTYYEYEYNHPFFATKKEAEEYLESIYQDEKYTYVIKDLDDIDTNSNYEILIAYIEFLETRTAQ